VKRISKSEFFIFENNLISGFRKIRDCLDFGHFGFYIHDVFVTHHTNHPIKFIIHHNTHLNIYFSNESQVA
jgi:hypothetical protein